DGHQVDDRDPHLYKTSDYGKTWKEIVAGIPKSPMSYAHVVKESPHKKGLLFAGTENALYVSLDDGAKWEPLQSKLPHAPVHWLTLQERFHDLVVATYGRGFYILDDTTPLEAMTLEVRASAAHLFAPREAYRFRGAPVPALAPVGTSRGRNPSYGATLNYWLKEKLETPHVDPAAEIEEADRPKKPVEITVLDASGALVRTLHRPSAAGLNRT